MFPGNYVQLIPPGEAQQLEEKVINRIPILIPNSPSNSVLLSPFSVYTIR